MRRLLALVLLAGVACAEEAWKVTGTAVRVKKVGFVSVKVYEVESSVKALPAKKKQALIDHEGEKKLVWTMLRDVEAEKIVTALHDGFALNAYSDKEKIAAFTKPFGAELKEKSRVTISWDPVKRATSVEVESGGGKASVEGVEFMKAVWSLWFGKIDQETLGDELLSKMP